MMYFDVRQCWNSPLERIERLLVEVKCKPKAIWVVIHGGDGTGPLEHLDKVSNCVLHIGIVQYDMA